MQDMIDGFTGDRNDKPLAATGPRRAPIMNPRQMAAAPATLPPMVQTTAAASPATSVRATPAASDEINAYDRYDMSGNPVEKTEAIPAAAPTTAHQATGNAEPGFWQKFLGTDRQAAPKAAETSPAPATAAPDVAAPAVTALPPSGSRKAFSGNPNNNPPLEDIPALKPQSSNSAPDAATPTTTEPVAANMAAASNDPNQPSWFERWFASNKEQPTAPAEATAASSDKSTAELTHPAPIEPATAEPSLLAHAGSEPVDAHKPAAAPETAVAPAAQEHVESEPPAALRIDGPPPSPTAETIVIARASDAPVEQDEADTAAQTAPATASTETAPSTPAQPAETSMPSWYEKPSFPGRNAAIGGTELPTSNTPAAKEPNTAATTADSETAAKTAAKTVPSAANSAKPSWLERWFVNPFASKEDKSDANPAAGEPYPSLASVPPTPAQFQDVKANGAQHLEELQQDHNDAQVARQQLAAEPSQQEDLAPVAMPPAMDNTTPAPAALPARQDASEAPLLLGHAADGNVAVHPDPMTTAAPAQPSTEPDLLAQTKDHWTRPIVLDPQTASDTPRDELLPVESSPEFSRVYNVAPLPASTPEVPGTAETPGTAEASPTEGGLVAAEAEAPAPVAMEVKDEKEEPMPALPPVAAAATPPAAPQPSVAAAQPVQKAPAVAPAHVLVPPPSALPEPAIANASPAPATSTPASNLPSVDTLPALTPTAAPVASVSSQDAHETEEPATTADAGGLPSPALLEQVKVMPSSRYGSRTQALQHKASWE